jgi:hypothetical protein
MGFIKIILCSVLISVLLLSQFNSSLILLNYQLNKEYIAQNLCENKDKPEMNCCGKCVVNKQLEKETQQKNKMNFTKEKETAKLVVRKLKLNDSFFNLVEQSFSSYIIHLPSIKGDIATPPPKFV